MTELADSLAGVRLWLGASEAALGKLARSAVLATYGPGAQVAFAGDPATRYGVVLDGRLRVYHLAADGRRLTLEDLGPLEPFAVPATLSGGRYPANVEAAEESRVAWFDRETLFELIESEPALARPLLSDLSRRIVNLTAVAHALSMDVPSRLAGFLFQRALAVGRPSDTGLVVELGMTKAELAEFLGTVPETLSRALGRLRGEGIIDVEGRSVRVHDVGALARLSSGFDDGRAEG